MHRGNALNEMTLKEEEGTDIPLQLEIYLSCGVNPAGEIANIWLLQTTASRIIGGASENVRKKLRQTNLGLPCCNWNHFLYCGPTEICVLLCFDKGGQS